MECSFLPKLLFYSVGHFTLQWWSPCKCVFCYKIFTSCYLFFYSEIQEIYTLPSQTDLSPVSGYLSFHEALRQQTIVVTATQDSEEENNEVFTVVLLTANNGGTLSETDSNAKITSKLSMVTKLKKYWGILINPSWKGKNNWLNYFTASVPSGVV